MNPRKNGMPNSSPRNQFHVSVRPRMSEIFFFIKHLKPSPVLIHPNLSKYISVFMMDTMMDNGVIINKNGVLSIIKHPFLSIIKFHNADQTKGNDRIRGQTFRHGNLQYWRGKGPYISVRHTLSLFSFLDIQINLVAMIFL